MKLLELITSAFGLTIHVKKGAELNHPHLREASSLTAEILANDFVLAKTYANSEGEKSYSLYIGGGRIIRFENSDDRIVFDYRTTTGTRHDLRIMLRDDAKRDKASASYPTAFDGHLGNLYLTVAMKSTTDAQMRELHEAETKWRTSPSVSVATHVATN